MLVNSINTSQFEYTVTGIDGTVASTVNLFTTLANAGQFCPTLMIVQLTAVAGFVSDVTAIGLGFNPIMYDNLITPFGMSLTIADHYQVVTLTTTDIPSVPPLTQVRVSIPGPAVAGTYTLSVTVIGNYL